jgi:hypothetical protein
MIKKTYVGASENKLLLQAHLYGSFYKPLDNTEEKEINQTTMDSYNIA